MNNSPSFKLSSWARPITVTRSGSPCRTTTVTSTVRVPRLVYPTSKTIAVGVTIDGRLLVNTPVTGRGMRNSTIRTSRWIKSPNRAQRSDAATTGILIDVLTPQFYFSLAVRAV